MVLGLDSPLMADICFALSKRMVLRRDAGSAGNTDATFDEEAYQAWRAEELEGQFDDNFDGSPATKIGEASVLKVDVTF